MIAPFLGLMLLAQATTAPYVRSRTTSTTDTEAACLHWLPGRLVLRQNAQGNTVVPGENELDAIARAIGHWKVELDRCGNLTLEEGARTTSRTVGYRAGSENNENVLLFRERDCTDVVLANDSCWFNGTCGNSNDCWEHAAGVIALTTTSYDPDTGRLFDADVEANAAGFVFTAVDSPACSPGAINQACVGFDVENTFTHELGHVLGLAHTNNPGSTMNPSAPLGETSKRIIDSGTLSFVCEAYPQGRPSTTCRADPDALTGTSFHCAGASPFGGGVLLSLANRLRRRRRRATA